MKKVLFINNQSYPVLDDLIEELLKRKEFEIELAVLSGEKGGAWNYESRNLNITYFISAKRVVLPVGLNRFDLYINPSFLSELSKINPSIIVLCGWDQLSYILAIRYAVSHGIKCILWAGSTSNEKSLLRIISKPFVRHLLTDVDIIIGFGNRSKNYLMDLGVSESKIILGYYACTLSQLSDENSKNQIFNKKRIEKRPVLLYVGQMIYRKGVDLLLNAFHKLSKRASLVLVGSGSELNSYKEKVSQEKIQNVFFMGSVDRKKLEQVYKSCDVFVLPSREEIWGLVVNEAISFGLPVIVSSAVGCVDELVSENKNGFIFKSENYNDLYEKLNTMIADLDLIKSMGKVSKKISSQYTIKRTANAFVQAFNS